MATFEIFYLRKNDDKYHRIKIDAVDANAAELKLFIEDTEFKEIVQIREL